MKGQSLPRTCAAQAGASRVVPSHLPLQASGAESNLPLSWAGTLWVAHGLAMSSVLASGCLDQVNFSHMTPTVCFVFYFCLSFPIHGSRCEY